MTRPERVARAPVVTAVRARGPQRVEVQLDGAPWRVVPLACAVEARLSDGCVLDRARARDLNRALRRHAAVTTAVRALRHADHSRAALAVRLEQRGVAAGDRDAALALLERSGLVDDERVAVARAEALARRGLGDAAIRADLEGRGLAPATITSAVEGLEPERARAERVVAERGASSRTARLLASRGFDEEAVESAIAGVTDEGLG